MWRTVREVARLYKLDSIQFEKFAMKNKTRYGIIMENGIPKVNSFYVDNMIYGFSTKPNLDTIDSGEMFELVTSGKITKEDFEDWYEKRINRAYKDGYEFN